MVMEHPPADRLPDVALSWADYNWESDAAKRYNPRMSWWLGTWSGSSVVSRHGLLFPLPDMLSVGSIP